MKFKYITGVFAIIVGLIFFGFNYDPLGMIGNLVIHVIGILFVVKGINLLFHKERATK
ncbi:hypothetical protein [Ureibacillus manganicus]|uniref:hypothetical protein n=1 Tax=Ureibacillus manganicus TaxID=1266064 RepID=UPI000B329478|nr:hypothetical protein [Ureibacillus manganicus]